MCRCRRRRRATEIWSWRHRYIGDKTIMRTSREEILQDMYQILGQLAEDWDYSGSIAENTLFRTDMGLESLDVVVLAASVQEHYDKVLPFNHLFSEVGQRDLRDFTVGEWVDFIYEHLASAPVPQAAQ